MINNNEDEDDFDIYGDLEDDNEDNNNHKNEINFDLVLDKNENKAIDCNQTDNDLILTEITILEKKLNDIENNNKVLVKENDLLNKELEKKEKQLLILKNNISSLYKTAKAEIERKKKEIFQLRDDFDSLVFKRIHRNSHQINCLNTETNNRNNNCDESLDKALIDKNIKLSDKMFCNKSTNTIALNNYDCCHQKKPLKDYRNSSNNNRQSRRSWSRSRSRSRNRSRHRDRGERHRKDDRKSSQERDRHRKGSNKSSNNRCKTDKHS